jgi:hypothetical protein
MGLLYEIGLLAAGRFIVYSRAPDDTPDAAEPPPP